MRPLRPILLPALVLGACASNGVPAPAGPEAAVLAVDVRVTGMRADAATMYPRRVLFVRVNGEFGAEEFAWSNYARGTRAYLFNATPGRWVVACAAPLVDGKEHMVFLPDAVVRSSAVDLAPGGVVSLGTAVVSESLAWDKADETQKRFHAAVLKRRPAPGAWRKVFPSLMDYRGDHGRHTPDDGTIAADVKRRIRSWGWER